MTTLPTPRVSRTPSLPLIWVVPIIALAIGGWLTYRELFDHGPEISIDFADGSGVEAGKTVLEYKGVAVGIVRSATLTPDLKGVTVQLRLDRRASTLATSGAEFWIVHPEIGFSGVHGLDTLVSGVRLNVVPGHGPPEIHFRGLDQAPALQSANAGRTFWLQSDHLGSLTVGAPVNYREVKVGEVEAIALADDAASVLARIRVYSRYADLVRTNSQFWNAGGVSIHVGLLGADIRSTSLESIATGAVGFATPDAPAAPAKDGTRFDLKGDVQKEWLNWRPKLAVKAPTDAG